jgi:hypothetical protein
LNAEISFVARKPYGRAIGKLRIDVALPEIAGLQDVHVRIHRFETILRHWNLL